MEVEIERIEQIKDLAGKLNCYVNEDKLKKLLRLSMLVDEDGEKEEILKDAEDFLAPHLPKLVFSKKPMLSSPKSQEIDEEIKVGKVVQGEKILYDFGLSREELNQHLLITARSGAGKSTLIVQIMRQLMSNGIPFIVLDFKQDYRHLIRHYPQLVVINWKDLRINPLEPPIGVSFQEWKQQFLNIFGHVEGIWQGSTQYLLEVIDEVNKEKNGLVTFEDVYNKIVESEEKTRKLQEYASVVQTRLYGLLSKLGNTINNERTVIDMEKLLQLPVVLELHGLGRDEATIITLWLFYWIYAYRRAQGMRGKLLHVLIIDEAKRTFTASEQYSQTTAEYSGIPPADLICDEIRDFGQAIIASDQEPTKLSNSLKANTFTKITGFLGNGKDIDDIAYAMDLDEETREVITKLERGEWLVKLAGRYVKPFMMKSYDFPLVKDLTDEELSQRMKHVIEDLSKDSFKTKAEVKLKRAVEYPLSESALKLLTHVNSYPFHGIVGRAKEMGVSMREIESAKKELIDSALVHELSFSLSAKKPTKFLVPTEKALQLLESQSIDTGLWKHIGNVGFEHTLYQVLTRYAYQKLGYEAHIEAKLSNGRRLDVLAVKGDRKIGVEVELNPHNDQENKLLGLEELGELYIVSSNEDNLRLIKSKLKIGEAKATDKIRLSTVNKFLTQLHNIEQEYPGINPSSQREMEFNRSRNLTEGEST